MSIPLTCSRCGAPLPPPESASLVQCGFCGTTSRVGAPLSTAAAPATPATTAAREHAQRFLAALQQTTLPIQEAGFLATVQRVGKETLGPIGETDAFLNIVGNLVFDFEIENGVQIRGDQMVVTRIVEAFFKACDTIADAGSARLHLPFLTADASGPKHLDRVVTAETWATLASRVPLAPENRRPGNGAPKSRKKGFLRRLFGG